MPEKKVEFRFEGSPVDDMRQFVHRGGLPPERAGYILARQALYHLTRREYEYDAPKFIDLAFHALTDDETANLHEPPLSPDLRGIALRYMQAFPYNREGHYGKTYGQTAALLVNMIIDHGSRSDY